MVLHVKALHSIATQIDDWIVSNLRLRLTQLSTEQGQVKCQNQHNLHLNRISFGAYG